MSVVKTWLDLKLKMLRSVSNVAVVVRPEIVIVATQPPKLVVRSGTLDRRLTVIVFRAHGIVVLWDMFATRSSGFRMNIGRVSFAVKPVLIWDLPAMIGSAKAFNVFIRPTMLKVLQSVQANPKSVLDKAML